MFRQSARRTKVRRLSWTKLSRRRRYLAKDLSRLASSRVKALRRGVQDARNWLDGLDQRRRTLSKRLGRSSHRLAKTARAQSRRAFRLMRRPARLLRWAVRAPVRR